jgi:hypothetical protein
LLKSDTFATEVTHCLNSQFHQTLTAGLRSTAKKIKPEPTIGTPHVKIYVKTGLTAFELSFNSHEETLTIHETVKENGICKGTFNTKDIDCQRFANELKKFKIAPNLVVEQCVKEKTPDTANAISTHMQDLRIVQEYFS